MKEYSYLVGRPTNIKLVAFSGGINVYFQHCQFRADLCRMLHGKLLPPGVHSEAGNSMGRGQISIYRINQGVSSPRYGDRSKRGLGWNRCEGCADLALMINIL
jgi:hypothetical protein